MSPTLNHMSYKVSAKRHLGKTISYRIISTLLGFLIMWFATGSIKIGAAFGVAELLIKPVLYYLHERVWYRFIKFGLVETKSPKKTKTSITPEPTLPPNLPEETQPQIKRLTYSKKSN